MEQKIQEAIKSARDKNKGKIASSKDIYEAIFKAGQESKESHVVLDGQEYHLISKAEDFGRLAEARGKAEAEFLKALHEASEIASNTKDYWKHLSSGAD